MEWLKKLWRGEYSLPMSYWVFLVIVGNVGSLVLLAIAAALNSVVLALTVVVVILAYNVVAIVGTWRSATNYTGWQGWAIIVKVLLVIGVLNVLVDIAASM